MATTISFPTSVTTNSANFNNTFAADGTTSSHPAGGWGSHSDIELSVFSSLSIPTGATIDGIEIVVRGGSNSNPNTPSFAVHNGSSWSSWTTSSIAPWSKSQVTYDPGWGSSSNLWGLSWSPTSAEGIKIKMGSSTITSGRRIFVDYFQVRVTYTSAAGYDNDVNTVLSSSIGSINQVDVSNINTLNTV